MFRFSLTWITLAQKVRSRILEWMAVFFPGASRLAVEALCQ